MAAYRYPRRTSRAFWYLLKVCVWGGRGGVADAPLCTLRAEPGGRLWVCYSPCARSCFPCPSPPAGRQPVRQSSRTHPPGKRGEFSSRRGRPAAAAGGEGGGGGGAVNVEGADGSYWQVRQGPAEGQRRRWQLGSQALHVEGGDGSFRQVRQRTRPLGVS